MPVWGINKMSRKILHAVLVLPDERILLERLTFNQIGFTPTKEVKWTISIKAQSFGQQTNVSLDENSAEINTLSRVIFRRFGLDVLNSEGLQVLHLFSHRLKPNREMSQFNRIIEVFRIKAFKNIKLTLDMNSEVKALAKSEIMANLNSGIFDEESVITMNMIDAMHVSL